jgi:integrase/recombinase XerC
MNTLPSNSAVEIVPASVVGTLAERNVMEDLLATKRSENTRKAYNRDLKDFFWAIAQTEPTAELVIEFLQLSKEQALSLVLGYKQQLLSKKLSEATVNRRLAAIKALVAFAYRIGQCGWTLAELKGKKVKTYRDTTGISPVAFKRMLQIPNRRILKGKRDYALLRLLWDNVLRREEVCQVNLEDLDLEGKTLKILGKGKGTQKEAVTLSKPTVEALQDWLLARRELKRSKPLFIALDRASYGHRLTGTGVYKIVSQIAREAGINKPLSPHRIRHSGITAALEATNGDVRKVQKLSRHSDLNTLMIYDDNRKNQQGEVTDLLADLV